MDLDTMLWITGVAGLVALVAIVAVNVGGRRRREAAHRRRAAEIAAEEAAERTARAARVREQRETPEPGSGPFGSGPSMSPAPEGQRRVPRVVPPLRGGPGYRRTGTTGPSRRDGNVPFGDIPAFGPGHWNSGPMSSGSSDSGGSSSSDSGGSSGGGGCD